MKKSIALFFLFFTFIINLNAQQKAKSEIKFPESFKLDQQDFLKAHQLIPVSYFKEYGYQLSTNPGIIKDERKFYFITEFDVDDISQVYYEIYSEKSTPDKESFSIVVAEFKTEKLLIKNLSSLEVADAAIASYFIVGKYIIIIRGDHKSLSSIGEFYVKTLRGKYYQPKIF